MWLTIIILLSILIILILPWIFGVPYWIHLPVALLYWLWVPRENKNFRSWPYWKFLQGRFTVKGPGSALLLNPSKKQKKTPHMYAVHPHGVYASTVGLFVALRQELLHIKPVGTSVLFHIPVLKEFVGAVGAIKANRKDIFAALMGGDSVCLCPGGLREIPGLDSHRVKEGKGFVQREGFIRIAQHCGVPLVPIYVTNENLLYNVYLFWPSLQRRFLSWFLYPWPVIAIGRWYLPFWPKPLDQEIWVGNPIETKDKTVEDLQQEFYSKLKELKEIKQ